MAVVTGEGVAQQDFVGRCDFASTNLSAALDKSQHVFRAGGPFVKLLVRLRLTALISWYLRLAAWWWFWRHDPEEQLQRALKRRRQFEEDVYGWWCAGLDALDLMWLQTAREIEGHHVRTERKLGDEIGRSSLEAQAQLMARACRVTSEISALLRTGHPEAAASRWRTLHEVVVTMLFLAKHGDPLAERYLEHPIALAVRRARADHDNALRWGTPELTARELSDLSEVETKLRRRHKSGYQHDYGWARPAFPDLMPKESVWFADLEHAVGKAGRRPRFRDASDTVHAGAIGLEHGLVRGSDGSLQLLVGPRDTGLADIGTSAGELLLEGAGSFLGFRKTTHSVASFSYLAMLGRLNEERWAEAASAFAARNPSD